MTERNRRRGVLLAALALLPACAYANTGVPILARTMTGMVIALIPIIAIESLVLRDQLGISALSALGTATVANIVSTLVGVGLAASEILLAPVFVIMVDSTNILTLILLLPLFFLSVVIERPVVGIMTKSADVAVVRRAILIANACSYVLIAAFVAARIVKLALA
jgi:hypothetical protein